MKPAEVSTPSDREVLVKRSFDAPVNQVWEAYTDRALMRRWLLLRRHDSRHEHRQEKSCCLHVSFLAWASVPSSKSNDAPRNRRL